MSTLYYLGGAQRRDKEIIVGPTPPDLPPINYGWLDDWLNTFHTPTGAYSSTYSVNSHIEAIQAIWADYRDNGRAPYKDGLYYYDFAQSCWEAYYYFQARGQTPDARFIDAADAAVNAYWKSMLEDRYLVVYHFPGGLYLSSDAGRVLTPDQYADAISHVVFPISGTFMLDDTYVVENATREISRLEEFYMDYFRIRGQLDPLYSSTDRFWGQRYHFCAGTNLPGHAYDWMDEWHDNPEHPPFDDPGGSYTGPIDYMWRSVDPVAGQGVTLRALGPFMTQFHARALIRLYGEDANYQLAANATWVQRIQDLHNKPATPPGNGGWDATKGFGLQYCSCSSPTDPLLVQPSTSSAFCDWSVGTGRVWGYRYTPTLAATTFCALMNAWLFRITNDQQYINKFVEIWELMEANVSWLNDRTRNDTWGGKETNQICWNLFAALNVAGYMQFKTHCFPHGYPYNTPPIVSP